MTYQEILVEFNNIRAAANEQHQDDMPGIVFVLSKRVSNLEWAMQSILEKLRDTEPT